YSRADREGALRLYALLKEQGREVWTDWQSIPATTEWETEVARGIDQADVFVIVLSPAWVASPECAKELGRARQRNKRLVPLLFRAVDAALAPEDVRAIQWIPLGDEELDAAAALSLALDTDYGWLREHTRLLERALDWERTGGNRSTLLRGTELESAAG